MKKIILLLVIVLFSCKDYGNPLSLDNGNSGYDDSLSYTYSDIHNILDLNCSGCHDYTSYDKVITSGSIISGDAASSILYNRITLLEEDPLSMPQNLPKLSDEDIAIIEKWINEGALSE
tara:strand:- start:822 stop:1178 length:357 start_codon:yes stop_codon:yes gene_type:complete